MAKANTVNLPDDLVTFEDSEGNIISNDPRFHALKTLGIDVESALAGISFNQSQPEEAAERTAAASGVVAEAPKKVKPKAAKPVEPTAEPEEEAEEEEPADDYSSVKGKELVTLAHSRGVETKGRNAGDVRADLVALDLANLDEDEEIEDEDTDEDDSEDAEDDDEEL